MTRNLLILRHAKSAWDTGALSDFERPLKQRGLRDATRMGRWMRARGLVPDRVISSPAERARQTTMLVAEALGSALEEIRWEPRLYEAAGAGRLVEALADCPASSRRVLLVAHNPALEALLEHLCGAVPVSPDGKRLATASLAEVTLAASWSALQPGAGTLERITRPKQLH